MKKLITLMSVLALLASGSAFAAENDIMLISAAPENIYSDVTSEHWAHSQIEKWSKLNIIQGNNGAFRPNDYITRGEVAVILDRVMDYQIKADNSFTDLQEKFYTEAILKANEAGVIKGYGDTVKADQNITRQEAVVMIARALGIEESDTKVSFDDKNEIASWAEKSVNAMAEKGYIQGNENKFNPLKNITRAELVTILNNAIEKIYTVADTYKDEEYKNIVVVNVADVVLENVKVGGNLIVAEGVAEGDLTLKSVTVDGKLIVRGGGVNSIYVNKSKISRIEIEKNPEKPVRVYVAKDSKVDEVIVKESEVSLDGEIDKVTLAEAASVKVLGEVKTLDIAEEAKGSKINNEGTIKKANINADSVVINGEAPTTTNVSKDVTEAPVDGEGNEIKETEKESSGGGGGGSSSGSGSSSTVTTAAITVTAEGDVYTFDRTSSNSIAKNVKLTVTFGENTYTGTLSTKDNAVTLINSILADMDNDTIIATLDNYKDNDTITEIAFELLLLSGADYQAIVNGSKDAKEAAAEALETLTLEQIITLANAVCN